MENEKRTAMLHFLAVGKCFSCVKNCPPELRIENTKWMKIAPVYDAYNHLLGYRCIELTTGNDATILDDEVLPWNLVVEVCENG